MSQLMMYVTNPVVLEQWTADYYRTTCAGITDKVNNISKVSSADSKGGKEAEGV